MHAIAKATLPLVLLTALGLSAGAAAAQQPAPPEPATAIALNDMTMQYQRLANARNADALAALYTPDAIFMNGTVLANGHAAVLQAFQSMLPSLSDFSIHTDNTQVAGNVAYATGTVTMNQKTDEGTTPITADWLAVSVHQPDGSWRIARQAIVYRTTSND